MTLTAPQSPDTRPDRVGADRVGVDRVGVDRVGADRVGELQARIRGMEARRLDTKAVPTHPALAGVLPGGVLREGTVVQATGSTSLLMTLLAGPSGAGRWVAVSGIPEFGVEAAAGLGIALDRLVLVPDPGRQWLTVAAALVDVIPIVAVRPTTRVSPAEASRLQARLRQRGTVLVSDGVWPGADTVLEVDHGVWSGLEQGHGALAEREVVVRTGGRGFVRAAGARLRLPDRTFGASVAPAPIPPRGDRPGETPDGPLGAIRHVDFRRAG